MAANPWIRGSSSPPPPSEGGEGTDEQRPTATADTKATSSASASYADRFLAAREPAAQAAPGESEQMSEDSAEPRPSSVSDNGTETQAVPPSPSISQVDQQRQSDVREDTPPKKKERPFEKPNTASRGDPADENRELLHALHDKREKTPNAKLGKFSRKRERQAVANLRELSLVEGNLMGLGPAVRTLYFTSCFVGEGKTTALLEAAYGLAVHGSRPTLVIDGNSDNPCLHGEFGLPNRDGFRDVLRGTVSLQKAIHPTAHETLYVMPCGNGKSTPDTAALADMLRTLADNFDFVLIDGKPLLSSSEVSATAPKLDGVLLVVECEKTKWEVVQLAQDKLSAVEVKNTGVVLNRRRFYIPKPIYRLMSR